jgi:putative ABC transport system substrate-binding protein
MIRVPPGGWLLILLCPLLGSQAMASGPNPGTPVILFKSGPLAPYEKAATSFVAAYREEVTTVALEDGDPDALQRRIEAARPEVIVAIGLKAALFARDRLPRIPLVFSVVPNYERFDLRGASIGGVSVDVPPDRDLAALRGAVPGLKRVGLLYGRSTGAALARRARAAAQAAGLALIEAPVSSLPELQKAARDLADRTDALWIPADPTVATPEAFRFLLDLSLARRKPLLAFSESLVRSGALLAVSPDYDWLGARTAEIVRRIRNGERAGDIGVLPLQRTHVVFNPATAHALGLATPASLVGTESMP